jgi:hypothetical protein
MSQSNRISSHAQSLPLSFNLLRQRAGGFYGKELSNQTRTSRPLVQFEPRAKPIVAIAVHCRSHMTIKTTPAVAAGWAKEPWTLERLLKESASSLS